MGFESTTPTIIAATVASSAAIAYLLMKKPTTTTKTAIAAAGELKLPPRFIVSSFTNKRSQSIHTVHLPRKDETKPPKAMLFLAHGIAEHCCRPGFIRLFESLSDAGVDVYSHDHHGHGRSDGEPRGYADSMNHFVEDLEEYIDSVSKEHYKDKGQMPPPLILMGQSMGGLVSLLTTLHIGNDRVSGIILTAPALGVDLNLELRIQKFFAPVIDTVAPKARIVDAVSPWEMSRNKEAVQRYIDDPLTQTGKLVARTAIGMSNGFDVVRARRGEITVPILAMHGMCDKCTWPKATDEFFCNVGTPVEKKKYLKLPAMYHELLEEPETDQILEYITVFAASAGKEFANVPGEEVDGVIDVVFK